VSCRCRSQRCRFQIRFHSSNVYSTSRTENTQTELGVQKRGRRRGMDHQTSEFWSSHFLQMILRVQPCTGASQGSGFGPVLLILFVLQPASARGVGIKVINKWSQLPKKMSLVVQRYISNPYLINGSKFDLRLYVLVTSFNPLRIYLYPDGLARFASGW
jgi:hypothetical protein